jgi:hypothetical protein
MIFAAEYLHLPVPKVHRTFTASVPQSYSTEYEDGHFIVMDYIAGPTVQEAWPSLEQDARQSVTRQVADMIETMQSRRLDDMPPGPFDSPMRNAKDLGLRTTVPDPSQRYKNSKTGSTTKSTSVYKYCSSLRTTPSSTSRTSSSPTRT